MIQKCFTHLVEPGAFQGTIEFDVPLSKYTYYRIGGTADAVVTPRSIADLEKVHQILHQNQLPFFILGWGSNILISDQGLRGVVIRMKHLGSEIEEQDGNLLRLGASVGGSTLLRRAQQKGYGGLSLLTGIPGSVGGMVTMNAGTHLGEWKDIAVSVETVNLNASSFQVQAQELTSASFSYRMNHFLKPGDLVTAATIRFRPEEAAKVEAEINHLYTRRKETQPVDYPSCGSVFMNPRASGLHAWQVIDRLKLRGHRIGDAQFAEKHCNFIINHGSAKASEVRALIALAQSRALQELGVVLEAEVKYVE